MSKIARNYFHAEKVHADHLLVLKALSVIKKPLMMLCASNYCLLFSISTKECIVDGASLLLLVLRLLLLLMLLDAAGIIVVRLRTLYFDFYT